MKVLEKKLRKTFWIKGKYMYEIPENAVIESIKEIKDEKIEGYNYPVNGLVIETDLGDIKLVIESDRACCELFGNFFFETPDSIDKFIGARILAVESIDIDLSSELGEDEERQETQLKITTSKGVIQYAVYNSHNGYYSHASITQVFDNTETDCL